MTVRKLKFGQTWSSVLKRYLVNTKYITPKQLADVWEGLTNEKATWILRSLNWIRIAPTTTSNPVYYENPNFTEKK
jgi:hypothetical protein